MEAVFMSVATTPGWIAAKVNPSSGVTSDAQLSVTAVTSTVNTATNWNLASDIASDAQVSVTATAHA